MRAFDDTWPAENQLVKVESRTTTPLASRRKVEWQYDALGRRIRQTTADGSSGSWVVTEDLKFVSDPLLFRRQIAELNATNNAMVRSYVWGLDLSGNLDGAGGVGGLLAIHDASTLNNQPSTHFVCYDGNANVAGLISATTGTETARHEYGSFGEPLRLTGPMALENPFRFSTKRTDNTTDLVLYEYRAYNATLGRWLSRDLIEERGGRNPYGFVRNTPGARYDYLGLQAYSFPPRPPEGEKPGSPSKGKGQCCDHPCDTLYAKQLTGEVLTTLLPGDQPLGEPDVVEEMGNRIDKMIKKCRRRPYSYIRRLAAEVLDMARKIVGQVREQRFGVKVYTVLGYEMCLEVHCGGVKGAIKKLRGKCSELHWQPFSTEPRQCNPTSAEAHPENPGAFLNRETAQNAIPRCEQEHEDEFARTLR